MRRAHEARLAEKRKEDSAALAAHRAYFALDSAKADERSVRQVRGVCASLPFSRVYALVPSRSDPPSLSFASPPMCKRVLAVISRSTPERVLLTRCAREYR